MSIAAYAENMKDKETIIGLAEQLGIPVLENEPDKDYQGLLLRFNGEGLALTGDGLALKGDFTRMQKRLLLNNLNGELLVRAAKMKKVDGIRTAIDATAGLGEDALLLAAAGFSVRLYEYNPFIAALLRDAMVRAEAVDELEEIVKRMELFEENSLTALPNLTESPDLILLDPMFPARQKSGLVKKKFQLLQQLEQPCIDETELVQAAISAKPKKIVIKRPPKGPYLAGIKPSYSIEGKGIRFDCLVL